MSDPAPIEVVVGAAGNPNEALMRACAFGDLEAARGALAAGAAVDFTDATAPEDVDDTPYFHMSALHVAADSGASEICALLLDRDAEIECRDPNDSTPLHLAAEKNHLDCVRLLVSRGADVAAIGSGYRSAFQEAVLAHRFEMAELLLASGADIEQPGGGLQPRQVLFAAVMQKNIPAVRWLLEKGADPYRPCPTRYTAAGEAPRNAVQQAAISRLTPVEVFCAFLEFGIDPDKEFDADLSGTCDPRPVRVIVQDDGNEAAAAALQAFEAKQALERAMNSNKKVAKLAA